jgi:hypothetical protein
VTCRTRVESLYTCGNIRWQNIQILPKTCVSITVHCMTYFPPPPPPLNKPKDKFMHSSNTQNTTESNCIISHAQNRTALRPNVFLTAIYRLMVTSQGEKVRVHLPHPQKFMSWQLGLCDKQNFSLLTFSPSTFRFNIILSLQSPCLECRAHT